MSIWYEIENEWEVEYNGDDDTFEILFRTNHDNEYVSVPAKIIFDLIRKYGLNNEHYTK